jgi:hypothetical protein
MSNKVLVAREIEVPADLPEKLDAMTNGKSKHTLREILVNDGKAHPDKMNKELIDIALGREIRNMMQSSVLPGKPNTVDRLRDVLFASTFAYILGTCYFNEDGDFNIGHNRDISFVSQLLEVDKVKFRNGKTCDPQHFLLMLNVQTDEDSIKHIYRDIFGGIMRKTPKGQDWYNLAKLVTTVGDKIVEKVTE